MEDLIDIVRLDGSCVTATAIEGFEYLSPSAEGATVVYQGEEFIALNINGTWKEWP